MRSFIVAFIVIVLIEITITTRMIGVTEMQSFSKSECPTRTSRRVSHYIPYTETYKARSWGPFYRIETRKNYRIEYVTLWVTTNRCCDGYHQQGQVCKPVCTNPCINGNCVLPNTCQCHQGFAPSNDPDKQDYLCEPKCITTCSNGKCAEPNVCSCDTGYELTPNKLECLPMCEENCEANNGRCTMPNTCSCNPGYKRINDTKKCEPICEEQCINGDCVAPNVCSCKEGYEGNSENVSLCTPKCEHGCLFGTCTTPNNCTCNDGYAPKNESVCEPICSQACKMGTCIAPETCSCDEGYGLIGNSTYVCEPICEQSCVNGVCTAPGVCVCNEGFSFNSTVEEERICKPVCKIPCEPYGTCVAPERCNCTEGYRVIDRDRIENEIAIRNNTEQIPSACEPVCNQACINGKCDGPDTCSCNPGYQPSQNGTAHVCEPICEKSCGPNSTCTEPNVCTCNLGYEPIGDNITNDCQPICDVPCGQNGTCGAPNVCTCDDGYASDWDGQCHPFCTSPCYNGTCVAPDTCKCSEGYTPWNETACVPFCENDCKNGECIAPNICQCNPGFVINNNGSCINACTRDCSGHGVCVDEEKPCECNFGWSGWNCNKLAYCVLLLDVFEEDVEKVEIQKETNSTIVEILDGRHYCYLCRDFLTNESLCYTIRLNTEDAIIGCFISTDLPCATIHRRYEAIEVAKVAGSLAAGSILIMAGAIVTAYILYRRRQRKEMNSAIARSALFQGAIANESLLTDEEISLH